MEFEDAALFPEENPFPVLRIDASGMLLYANAASDSLLSSWQCRVGDASPPFIRQSVTACLEGNRNQELEVEIDGRDISLVIVPIAGRGYVNLYGRDITDRKLGEVLSRAMHGVNQLIHSTLDFDAIMRAAIAEAASALRADSAAISLRKRDQWLVSYVYNLPSDTVGSVMKNDEERHAVLAIQTKVPVAVSDVCNDERVNREHMKRWGIRSVLTVPLIVRGEAIGVAFFNYQRSTVEFRDPHLDFAVKLSASVALALENARLFSDLKAIETNLRESEARERARAEELRALLDLAPAAIWIAHDPQCRVITGNAYADELIMKAPRGGNISRSAEPGGAAVSYRVLREGIELRPEDLPAQVATATGKPVTPFSQKLIFPDGRTVELLAGAVPLFDVEGRVRGAVVAGLDVTALERARKELIEADRRKDEFLAMLAHELRNPLAVIANAIEILKRGGPAESALKSAQDAALRQTAHMTRLLDDLLDAARVTQGKVTLKREEISLTSVLESAIEASNPVMNARKHRLLVSHPREPMRLLGDKVRLCQAICNLLHNSAKYTPPGGDIYLTVERDGDRAVIAVRDHGVGIEPELLPRAFELFVQGSRSPDRSEGGLGIGLTLVRSLVQLHGGEVEAHSDGPGKGSEFRIYLPLLLKPAGRICDRESLESETIAPLRILVVDDNADSADMLAALLGFEGHEVIVANSGCAGIEMALKHLPDVALVDIGMPGMDGYETARRLREAPELRSMALVALTGYGQQEDMQKSREAGFDQHLVKPVDIATLGRALKHSGKREKS